MTLSPNFYVIYSSITVLYSLEDFSNHQIINFSMKLVNMVLWVMVVMWAWLNFIEALSRVLTPR